MRYIRFCSLVKVNLCKYLKDSLAKWYYQVDLIKILCVCGQDFRGDLGYEYEPIVDMADLDFRHAKRSQSPSKYTPRSQSPTKYIERPRSPTKQFQERPHSPTKFVERPRSPTKQFQERPQSPTKFMKNERPQSPSKLTRNVQHNVSDVTFTKLII